MRRRRKKKRRKRGRNKRTEEEFECEKLKTFNDLKNFLGLYSFFFLLQRLKWETKTLRAGAAGFSWSYLVALGTDIGDMQQKDAQRIWRALLMKRYYAFCQGSGA